MGITEILRRIWLFSANKIKSPESVSKQPTQHIVELNSSLRQKLATNDFLLIWVTDFCLPTLFTVQVVLFSEKQSDYSESKE